MTRFRNLDGSGPQGSAAVFRWMVLDTLAGRRRKSPNHAPVPTVPADLDLLAHPPGPDEPARLTWIGHASWLVQLDGISLLVDPVFGRVFPGLHRNVPAPFTPRELPPIRAVLVSHAHYDHLDLPSVRAANSEVITGLGMRQAVGKAAKRTVELEWWASTDVDGVRISFVPSQHWSRRRMFDTNRALWGGFVIEGSRSKLYHSGDTAWFEGFSEIGRRFPLLDAAMLPIGAYDPGWFMEKQHMNPEQAVDAFVDLGARAFFAMHWGTFKLTDEPLDEPPQRVRAAWRARNLPEAALHVCAVGESVTLPAG